MKLIIEEKLDSQEEDVVIVRAHNLSEQQWMLLHQLTSKSMFIIAMQEGKIVRIAPKDVFYFEAVDHKVFLYTEKEVYEIKSKLYEVEEQYIGCDFFRVSKSIILNLTKIKHLSPVIGNRLEATLINDEKIIISRQYVAALKVLLGV